MRNFPLHILPLKLKLFVFSLLMFEETTAQIAEVWTYGGAFFEEGRKVIECAAGGYALVGTTGSNESTITDIYLSRLDENLQCTWSAVIGSNGVDWGYDILEDTDGNLVLCGYTNENSMTGYDILIVKLNSLGEIIWKKTFGGTNWDFGKGIIQADEQSYLVCGYTYSGGNGNSDGILIQIDLDGNLIHEYTYGGSGFDQFTVLLKLDNGNFVVGGSSDVTGESNSCWLLCLDSGLYSNWQKHYTNFGSGTITDIELSDDSSILVSASYDINDDHENGFVENITSDGNFIFHSIFEETSVESIIRNENHIYLCGVTSSFGLGGDAAIIFRLDLYGAWQTGAAFGDVQDDKAFNLQIDSNGAVLMLGSSSSYSSNGAEDIYLVRFADSELVSNYTLDLNHSDCFTVDLPKSPPIEKILITSNESDISLQWISGIYSVSIYDLLGRSLYKCDEYRNGTSISISSMNSGNYIVTFSDNQGHFGSRLINK